MDSYRPLVLLILVSSAALIALLSATRLTRLQALGSLSILIAIGGGILASRCFECASDYNNYLQMFERSATVSSALNAYHGDYSFAMLMWLANISGLPFNFYLIAFSILTLSITAVAHYLFLGSRAPVSFALFFSTSTFVLINVNVLRQGLFTALFLLLIAYFFQSKNLKVVLLSPIVFFSHSGIASISSLFLLLSHQLAWQYKKWPVFITVVFLVSSLAFGTVFFGLFLSFPLIGDFLADVKSRSHGLSPYYKTKVLLMVLLAVVFSFLEKNQDNRSLTGLKLIFLGVVCLILISANVPIVSDRFIYISSAFVPIIVVSQIESFFKSRESRFYGYCFFIQASFLYSLFVYNHVSIAQNIGLQNLANIIQ